MGNDCPHLGGEFHQCWRKGRSGILGIAAHTRDLRPHPSQGQCLGSQLFSLCIIPKWKVLVWVCFQTAVSCAVSPCWHLLPAPDTFVKISWSSQQSRHRHTLGRFRDLINLGESLLFALFFWLQKYMFFQIIQTQKLYIKSPNSCTCIPGDI